MQTLTTADDEDKTAKNCPDGCDDVPWIRVQLQSIEPHPDPLFAKLSSPIVSLRLQLVLIAAITDEGESAVVSWAMGKQTEGQRKWKSEPEHLSQKELAPEGIIPSETAMGIPKNIFPCPRVTGRMRNETTRESDGTRTAPQDIIDGKKIKKSRSRVIGLLFDILCGMPAIARALV